MKRFTFLTVIALVVGLLAGAAAQAAKPAEIFRPSQPPIGSVKVAKEAGKFAKKMDREKRPSKNYISYASRKTSKFVSRLNDLGKQRRVERNEYLSDKLTEFEKQLDAPIEARYDAGIAGAERTYKAAVRKINRGKGSKSKKQALIAQANSKRQAREAALAQKRAEEHNRALQRVNQSRQASQDVLAKLTADDKLAIKRDKVNLRTSLADLRKRNK